MNPVDANEAPAMAKPIDPPPERSKAVLFCPECDHESHVAGDWQVRDDYVAGTRSLTCPECRATVTERPLPRQSVNADVDGTGEERGTGWAAVSTRDPWETWRDLWVSSVELVVNLSPRQKC